MAGEKEVRFRLKRRGVSVITEGHSNSPARSFRMVGIAIAVRRVHVRMFARALISINVDVELPFVE